MMFLRLTPPPADDGLTWVGESSVGLRGPGEGSLPTAVSAGGAVWHSSGEENGSQRWARDPLWAAVEPPGGWGALGCRQTGETAT